MVCRKSLVHLKNHHVTNRSTNRKPLRVQRLDLLPQLSFLCSEKHAEHRYSEPGSSIPPRGVYSTEPASWEVARRFRTISFRTFGSICEEEVIFGVAEYQPREFENSQRTFDIAARAEVAISLSNDYAAERIRVPFLDR